MALCSLPSARFILYSTNALAIVSVLVQEASKFPDIKIVNFDWLTATINSRVRADEANFALGQTDVDCNNATNSSVPPAPKQNDVKSKSRKRLRSPTPSEGEFSNSEDFESQAHIKKPKDVQRASSSSLFIPVDETCPLAGTVSIITSLFGQEL